MFKFLEKRYKKKEEIILISGILGIVLNSILSAFKIVIGILSNSIAITADGFNNFFDVTSSVVAVVSAKFSSKKADDNHPFGHGRFEYISALVIAFIIVIAGFEILRKSYDKLFVAVETQYGLLEIILMGLAVVVKIWMVRYNRYIAKKYSSHVNAAVASDSRNDALSGIAIFICLLFGRYVDYPLDAIAGLILSVYIMYSGYLIARDMMYVLLGAKPSDELVEQIKRVLASEEMIKNVHDIYVHDYGMGHAHCTAHVGIPSHVSLIDAHTAVDQLEKKVKAEIGVDITLHVDPIIDGVIAED